MKTAKLSDIKKELQHLSPNEILEVCLRLARYKKENKELIAYLLFEAHDIDAYNAGIKENIDEAFEDINTSNLYLAKKTLRKILKQANKYIRYTANNITEVEVLMYFCSLLKTCGIPIHKNKAINNIYLQQLKKIKAAIALLHEDIQYDYNKKLEEL